MDLDLENYHNWIQRRIQLMLKFQNLKSIPKKNIPPILWSDFTKVNPNFHWGIFTGVLLLYSQTGYTFKIVIKSRPTFIKYYSLIEYSLSNLTTSGKYVRITGQIYVYIFNKSYVVQHFFRSWYSVDGQLRYIS